MTATDPSPVQSPAAAAGAMKPSEALRKARQEITPDGSWMQNALASKRGDQGVRFSDPKADCFCSYGALLRAIGEEEDGDAIYDPYTFFQRATGCTSIVIWNDTPGRTHAEVLAAFDRAAELAAAEGR